MPTINDIAARCGVAKSTVSNVLNGKGHASSELRAKILQVIEELGYVPSQTARALSSSRRTGNLSGFQLVGPLASQRSLLFTSSARLDIDFYWLGALELASTYLATRRCSKALLFLSGDVEADKILTEVTRAEINGMTVTSEHVASTVRQGVELSNNDTVVSDLAYIFAAPSAALGYALGVSMMVHRREGRRHNPPIALSLIDAWELKQDGTELTSVEHYYDVESSSVKVRLHERSAQQTTYVTRVKRDDDWLD